MSLSWTESLHVALCPDRVGLVRLSRGWQRMLEGNVAASQMKDASMPPWAAALAALGEQLSSREPRDAEVTVVLSNHFVRYLLVPWSDSLSGEAEANAHARHCFSRVYGPVADSWDIRISIDHDGPQVASAIDSELLARLDQMVAASGRRLVSIQPYLMTAFNRWRREFVGPVVWFILVERGRLCLAALQKGRWSQLINLKSDASQLQGLPDLLERQRVLSGLEGTPGEVYVAAPDKETELILQRSGEQVRSLRRGAQSKASADAAACFEMALDG